MGEKSFGYVVGVLYLCGMIYLKTPTRDLSVYQIRRIVCETISWCETNIGRKKKKKNKVKFHVRLKSPSYLEMFGQYKAESKSIILYRDNCKSVKDIIRTTLHEYRHHLQDLDLYNLYLFTVGYRRHPQEIEARATEKLYSECWGEIKDFVR